MWHQISRKATWKWHTMPITCVSWVLLAYCMVCRFRTGVYDLANVVVHCIRLRPAYIKPMTDARETRTRNSHEKLAWNRTRSIWSEKLAREIYCCKSEWQTYELTRTSFSYEFFVRVSWALLRSVICWNHKSNHDKLKWSPNQIFL